MKRIWFCLGILILVIAFAVICERYVSKTVNQTGMLLSQASESRREGDFTASQEYADAAWESWRKITKRSGYILADLTIAADVTVSLSRVGMIAYTDEVDRFLEECAATILMLEHFMADNKNFFGGSS